MLLRQGLLMVAAGADPWNGRSAIDQAFSGNADRWSEARGHNRVRWLGYVPRASRVGQHLCRLAADRHSWISLPFGALISQQRSLLSSNDTEFGVEEADEMLPDEIIDDEGDG